MSDAKLELFKRALKERITTHSQAYPNDIFTEFTKEELKQHASVITRASAHMGRHMLQCFEAYLGHAENIVEERFGQK